MTNTVYYHTLEVPEPYSYMVEDKKIEGVKDKELRCSDERVAKVWYYGGMSMKDDTTAVAYVSFIFKDGSRHEKPLTTDKWEEEATEFINSIQ